MKKILLFLLMVVFLSRNVFSQSKIWDETEEEKNERLQWWTDARFGMFIHWGLHAQAARHEWVKKREWISDEDYQKYFEYFNPDLINPTEWAKKAKAAGLSGAVITPTTLYPFSTSISKLGTAKSGVPIKTIRSFFPVISTILA